MQTALAQELRERIPVLHDLPDADLEWLASKGTLVELAAGEKLFTQGDDASAMFLFLSGEIQVRTSTSGAVARYITRAGSVGGVLPYSRMQTFAGTGYAAFPTRVLVIPRTLFPEMLAHMPVLGERLVGVMTDRVREVAMNEINREKLMALGKLSAGLAHELNNPAAAGFRSAKKLCETLGELRRASCAVDEHGLSKTARVEIGRLEELGTKNIREQKQLDALDRADAEEAIAAWLEERGVADAWRVAPVLADARLDADALGELQAAIGDGALGDALTRIVANVTVQRLAADIESATARISELIRSIKEYSYMDQSPIQTVDIHRGLDTTLTILNHKLKSKSIAVEREYDEALPAVQAYGSELNQVWTNLIDNAADAMTSGGRLRLRTAREGEAVLVEVTDDGHGIPPEVRSRIFEPFFTTKPVGEGTGLGLDAVFRIVQKHHGDIRVESAPGKTTFTVRLPLAM